MPLNNRVNKYFHKLCRSLSIFDLPHFMRYSASGLNAKPHIHLQWLLILVNPIQT